MNEVLKNMMTRRSIRSYTDRQISEEAALQRVPPGHALPPARPQGQRYRKRLDLSGALVLRADP